MFNTRFQRCLCNKMSIYIYFKKILKSRSLAPLCFIFPIILYIKLLPMNIVKKVQLLLWMNHFNVKINPIKTFRQVTT